MFRIRVPVNRSHRLVLFSRKSVRSVGAQEPQGDAMFAKEPDRSRAIAVLPIRAYLRALQVNQYSQRTRAQAVMGVDGQFALHVEEQVSYLEISPPAASSGI